MISEPIPLNSSIRKNGSLSWVLFSLRLHHSSTMGVVTVVLFNILRWRGANYAQLVLLVLTGTI